MADSNSHNNIDSLPRDLSNKIQTAEQKLEELSYKAGEKIGEVTSNLANTAYEYSKTTRNFVAQHPGRSVAVAAAAGLVAGSLLTLAFHNRH